MTVTNRRRYILYTIFAFPYARELIGELEKCFFSDDIMFVRMAFEATLKYQIPIADEIILSALRLHGRQLNSYWYVILENIQKSEHNYQEILALYQVNIGDKSKQERIAEALVDYANAEHFDELFNLFQQDEYSKIRLIACKIATKNNCSDLLCRFQKDSDGHVRKWANKYMNHT